MNEILTDLVDELGSPVLADSVVNRIIFLISVVARDAVEDPSLAVSDTSDIDGTADELSVGDLDVCVVLTVLLLTLLARVADRRPVLQVESLGQDR